MKNLKVGSYLNGEKNHLSYIYFIECFAVKKKIGVAYRTKLGVFVSGQWSVEADVLLVTFFKAMATFFLFKLEMINTIVCFKNFCVGK